MLDLNSIKSINVFKIAAGILRHSWSSTIASFGLGNGGTVLRPSGDKQTDAA